MDGYPAHYVSHNLPFVILFGLGSTDPKPRDPTEDAYPLLQEKGIYISSDLPNVTGPAAQELLSCFHDFDAKDAAWNNRPGKGKMGTTGFTYRSVGRAFTLPAHKAKPPSSMPSPAAEYDPPRRSSLTPVLHSPLSPLSPDSPTFPDGIMTHFWFSKHQWLLPSTLISFFNFSIDPNSSTLQDNKLKTELNALRTALTASAYKVRFIAVLVCEGDDTEASMLDRVGNIRRATSQDSKSLFFLPARLSKLELQAFVGTILASIQPSSMEYYRDLTKHARRKRNRGSVPPPTAQPTYGTSQTLSAQGWNVRYETKLGFFAEFRQEMDAASRNYEAAYEFLLDGDVFESVSNWSPRFDETRMLADVLAIRILRCLLWTGQTTSAVQSWSNHRARLQDLVDRRGKGTGTYGWEAWEARWSTVMAELIEKVDVPIFHVPDQLLPDTQSLDIPDIYAIPEKAFSTDEHLPPWDLLHHEGYWLTRSAQRTRARRKLALTMPKEDRSSPGTSPASHIASKSHIYDTYLCPEPHMEYGLPGHASFDYGALLVQTFKKAAGHFSKRNQNRAVERMEFEMARECMRAGRWEEAMVLVKPLWQKLSWRREGWWKLVEEMSWAVRACARHLGDGETLVAVEWELLSNSLTPRSNWQYDLSKCLDGLDIEEKPVIQIEFDRTAPCLSALFTFGTTIGRAGEVVNAQLTLISQAHAGSAAITLSNIIITFEGNLKDYHIRHDPNRDPIASGSSQTAFLYDASHSKRRASIECSPTPEGSNDLVTDSGTFQETLVTELQAEDDWQSLSAAANLKILPGTKKILAIEVLPRDAGEIQAAKASLSILEEHFDLGITIPLRQQTSRSDWWIAQQSSLSRKRLDTEHACSLTILPKPPKMQIELPTLRKAYYTDQMVSIEVQITNEEEEDADVRLVVRLSGNQDHFPTIHWKSRPGTEESQIAEHKRKNARWEPTAELSLGRLGSSGKRTETITFHALPCMVEYVLDIEAHYHLSSDPQTSISKTVTKDLIFMRPFDGSFDFSPNVHPEPWPSYFHYDDNETNTHRPKGLKQQWSLATKLTSFALELVIVHAVNLEVIEALYSVNHTFLESKAKTEQEIGLGPNDEFAKEFFFEVQKPDIEDRRNSVIRFQLEVQWSLKEAPAKRTTTIISVPQLTVPFGEPRLLASSQQSNDPARLVHLSYTLENPSTHLLTFQLTMDASEDFAFSGPKTTTMQLVPLSRNTVHFNLLPTRRGTWIRPNLKVVDVGFGQTLKVGAAEGCKDDKKGVAVWIDAV